MLQNPPAIVRNRAVNSSDQECVNLNYETTSLAYIIDLMLAIGHRAPFLIPSYLADPPTF